MTQVELFKVYQEPQEATQETPCMIAYLHTTAYTLQAWDYGEGGIRCEMSFKGSDDADTLEYRDEGTRDEAIACLTAWGAEIKALEDEESADNALAAKIASHLSEEEAQLFAAIGEMLPDCPADPLGDWHGTNV